LPESVQVLPGHAVLPVWHGLETVHGEPGVQLLPHTPPVQVMPEPHDVPSG
jgi:hypothetical protein